MHSFLIDLHSIWRYIILVLLYVVLFKSLVGWIKKQGFEKIDIVLSRLLLISVHFQFLFGLVLYFLSDLVQFNENTMKNETIRYWTVEHIFMMLLSIILITLGYLKSKKDIDSEKRHKILFLYTFISTIIIFTALMLSGRGLFTY
jgi:uncharacterized membrane protein